MRINRAKFVLTSNKEDRDVFQMVWNYSLPMSTFVKIYNIVSLDKRLKIRKAQEKKKKENKSHVQTKNMPV